MVDGGKCERVNELKRERRNVVKEKTISWITLEIKSHSYLSHIETKALYLFFVVQLYCQTESVLAAH